MARFQKGQSGNPGGRPKADFAIQELARSHGPAAIETLAKIAAKGKSESAQIAAATALLDRGYGKPAQLAVTDPALLKNLTDMTDEELLRMIADDERVQRFIEELDSDDETAPIEADERPMPVLGLSAPRRRAPLAITGQTGQTSALSGVRDRTDRTGH